MLAQIFGQRVNHSTGGKKRILFRSARQRAERDPDGLRLAPSALAGLFVQLLKVRIFKIYLNGFGHEKKIIFS